MQESIKANLILYRHLFKKAKYNKDIYRKLFTLDLDTSNKSKHETNLKRYNLKIRPI